MHPVVTSDHPGTGGTAGEALSLAGVSLMLAIDSSTFPKDAASMSLRLLEPFRLHDLALPNRVVMAPLTRSRSGPDRIPNAFMAEHYRQRSSAG